MVYKEKWLWNSIPSDLAPQIASTQPLPSGLSSSPINLRQLGPQVKLLWNRGLSYPSPTKAPLFQVVLGSSFASWWVILSDSSLSIPACTHIHCLTTYMSIYNMPLHTCYTRGTPSTCETHIHLPLPMEPLGPLSPQVMLFSALRILVQRLWHCQQNVLP